MVDKWVINKRNFLTVQIYSMKIHKTSENRQKTKHIQAYPVQTENQNIDHQPVLTW